MGLPNLVVAANWGSWWSGLWSPTEWTNAATTLGEPRRDSSAVSPTWILSMARPVIAPPTVSCAIACAAQPGGWSGFVVEPWKTAKAVLPERLGPDLRWPRAGL